MKEIRCNQWIARNLLFKDYYTTALVAWVHTKRKSEAEISQADRNQEYTRVRQWVECLIVRA